MAVRASRTAAQTFALALGAVYLFVGLVGFAVTGIDRFASATDEAVLVFGVNPLHNIVHIALGAAWLVGATTHAAAKRVNLILGALLIGLGALGAAGLFDGLLNADLADHLLHVVTGGLGVYFATIGAQTGRPARA